MPITHSLPYSDPYGCNKNMKCHPFVIRYGCEASVCVCVCMCECKCLEWKLKDDVVHISSWLLGPRDHRNGKWFIEISHSPLQSICIWLRNTYNISIVWAHTIPHNPLRDVHIFLFLYVVNMCILLCFSFIGRHTNMRHLKMDSRGLNTQKKNKHISCLHRHFVPRELFLFNDDDVAVVCRLSLFHYNPAE